MTGMFTNSTNSICTYSDRKFYTTVMAAWHICTVTAHHSSHTSAMHTVVTILQAELQLVVVTFINKVCGNNNYINGDCLCNCSEAVGNEFRMGRYMCTFYKQLHFIFMFHGNYYMYTCICVFSLNVIFYIVSILYSQSMAVLTPTLTRFTLNL